MTEVSAVMGLWSRSLWARHHLKRGHALADLEKHAGSTAQALLERRKLAELRAAPSLTVLRRNRRSFRCISVFVGAVVGRTIGEERTWFDDGQRDDGQGLRTAAGSSVSHASRTWRRGTQKVKVLTEHDGVGRIRLDATRPFLHHCSTLSGERLPAGIELGQRADRQLTVGGHGRGQERVRRVLDEPEVLLNIHRILSQLKTHRGRI